MFAEVAPLYLQSLGIGSYDTAVVQGVILRLWGTGMERACGAAFLQCRFMNPFGNVCQRHHAAEGEGQYEDAEKYSADVVPVIPSFSVGGELGMAASVRLTPYIHSYPNAGNDHETTQSCEPDDGLSPKDVRGFEFRWRMDWILKITTWNSQKSAARTGWGIRRPAF